MEPAFQEIAVRSRPVWRWYTYVVAVAWWALLILLFAGLLHRDIDGVSTLLGLIVICGFWWLTWASRHKRLGKLNDYFERAAAEALAAKSEREASQKRKLLEWAASALAPLQPPGLILKDNETCYWSEPATMGVIKTTTRRSGGYGGFSVRVPGTRGLRVNTGRFGSGTVSRSGRVAQTGSLAVTDRRIIFGNPEGTKIVPLSKVVGLHPFMDGVRLDIENSTPLVFLTGNQLTSLAIERIIHHDIGAVPISAVNLEPR